MGVTVNGKYIKGYRCSDKEFAKDEADFWRLAFEERMAYNKRVHSSNEMDHHDWAKHNLNKVRFGYLLETSTEYGSNYKLTDVR